MVEVHYKKLSETAREPFKIYDKDYCYDLVATDMTEIAPSVYEYKVGLAIEIKKETIFGFIPKIFSKYIPDINVSLDIRPRSSIWKTGLSFANSTGTIDELYRGELKIIFYQVILGRELYKVGDKIAQCKLGLTIPINWVENTELGETERGTGGFGSTGK